jgi:hypothetical protein
MICQDCGIEAPTKYVAFYQNIGALVVRFSKSIEGNLCKSCIHKYFWEFTGTNLVLGWWGMISLILNPFFILNNTGRYIFCLGMKPVPEGATKPKLTEEAIAQLQPHAAEIFERLGNKEPLDQVAEYYSVRYGVTPGQVVLFVIAVAEAAKNQQ